MIFWVRVLLALALFAASILAGFAAQGALVDGDPALVVGVFLFTCFITLIAAMIMRPSLEDRS